jgi:hypothetical protein
MSGTVNAAGWYISTNRDLENASLPSVLSEDIHNIEHYYKSQGEEAPIAEILYISCRDGETGESFFYRASNMPHTELIINKKFTAFAPKPEEDMVGTHGYGAVLPSMYIGGDMEIQFVESGKWKSIRLDVRDQFETCKTQHRLDLPSKAASLTRGTVPLVENAALWPPELLTMFRERGICIIEQHKSPTFKGRGCIRDPTFFCTTLESIQAQFEGILGSKAQITGIYVNDDHSVRVYSLPHNFYRDLHNTHTREFPVSPYGLSDFTTSYEFDVLYTTTSTHCRTMCDTTPFFFAIDGRTGACLPESQLADFTPRFKVQIGKVGDSTRDYAMKLTNDPHHPLYHHYLQAFAERILVDLDDYRMTLKPIASHSLRSNYLPYLADTRIRVRVIDADTKREYIDAKAHKDRSTLKDMTTSADPNVLEATVVALCKLVKRCADSETTVEEELTTVRTARRRTQRAAVIEGVTYEMNCLHTLQSGLEGSTIVGNDIAIRREFLDTNDKQFTGIDILVAPETVPLKVAIQCKRKERVTKEDCESFLRTLQYARTKYPQDYIPGVFVIQKTVAMTSHLLHVMETPGVQVVCVPEGELSKLLQLVESILAYYTTTA